MSDTKPASEGSRQGNPKWVRDEEILAFDLYLRLGDLGAQRSEVIELSELLRSLTIYPDSKRSAKFRSPGAVSRKLGDIHSHAPGNDRPPTSGSALDEKIWEEFGSQPERVHRLAALIRASAPSAQSAEEDEEVFEATHKEGRILYRTHRTRERSTKLRKQKISAVRSANGGLACEACGDDLIARYGEVGGDVFECHHLVPLSESGETVSSIDDLAVLCPTCHRVAHRVTPWPTLGELQALARRNPLP